MPTNYSGRVLLTLGILFAALLCIFPPGTLFRSGLTFRERLALKPGIDMVGGVSLIYKISETGDQNNRNSATNLAESVMEALKKRVDPDGVRNLVWRPIGKDEIEIQMPMASHSEDAAAKREAYTQALAAMQASNVTQRQVLDAVNMPAGAEREAKIAELAGGDPARVALYHTLAALATELNADRSAATRPSTPATDMERITRELDVDGEKFDDLAKTIDADNIDTANLEQIIDGLKTDPAKFQPLLDAQKQRLAQSPARLAALNDFIGKYTAFSAVKDQLDDASDLKRLLKGSGVLAFHILAYDHADPLFQVMLDRMKPGTGKGPLPQAEPADAKYQWFQFDQPSEKDKVGRIAATAEWNDKWFVLSLITKEASMDPAQGWALEGAHAGADPNGAPAVDFSFDTNGNHLFGDLTTRWKENPDTGQQYQLAIVLDNKIVSAPSLHDPITGGNGQITGGEGGFSPDEMNYLVNTLNAGSLPAQLGDEPISEHRIGPQLGEENLRKGLVACGFGLVVVGVFLIGYYYIAGIVAFFAVLLNLVIILGAMAALNATFTLPSIAGIVLTVGTAVDANVLIFERLREEQHRGLGLRMALRNSYGRALSAIVDSNMTSLITSVFLYWFGSEEVKGFGLTLIIGIVASLFTALFVTKTIFGIMIDKFGLKHLSSFPLTFPKWDKLLKPDIDWMGFAWVFYTFSIIAITAGLILFGVYTYRQEMMDIEFAKGTSVELEMKPKAVVNGKQVNYSVNEVRDLLSKADPKDLPALSVIAVGGESDTPDFQIVTTNYDATKVKNALTDVLGPYMVSELPSRFTGVDFKTAKDAQSGGVLFAIPADLHNWPQSARFWQGGTAGPAEAADYTGGVAIVLQNITPALKPSEIRSRIQRDSTQTPNGQNLATMAVVAPAGDDSATSTAVVLFGNPSLAYTDAQADRWLDQLATPAWSLVSGAVNHEATLRGVSSFDPSVAGAARSAAIIALTLSILVIMAYIWFRFGNLKYGTATVVALLHDTVFTLAALGFAHLLAGSKIGDALQLEPFRINLTVVAGILTIMGYSMIDTIVVFDRIRENRGKYGHLSKKIVNDAINQTLSRTLLTAGTTTMTVAFMYFLGGAGIHGFTFVLLIGILVGTYSSVAIAAPLLLVGKETQRGAQPAQRPASGVPSRV